jgi:hypothetical protein
MKATTIFILTGLALFNFRANTAVANVITLNSTLNYGGTTEDFKEFYQRFLTDSAFQISRLLFPLEGEKIVDDQTYPWTLDNWTIMKASVYEVDTTEYKVEIEELDNLKSFRVYIPDSGFELVMKFKLVSGKWYLFYCKDMFS